MGVSGPSVLSLPHLGESLTLGLRLGKERETSIPISICPEESLYSRKLADRGRYAMFKPLLA